MKFIFALIIVLTTQISLAEDWLNKLHEGEKPYLYIFQGNYQPLNSSGSTASNKTQDTLCGFVYQKQDVYLNPKYTIDLRKFFNGKLEAFGVACDSSKTVQEHFYIDMVGNFSNNKLKADQKIYYESGKEESRTWDYIFTNDQFTATGTSIVGTANGTLKDNIVNMQYKFRTLRGGITLNLNMDEWLYQIDDKIVVKRIFIRKFGFKVAEVLVIFARKK